MKISTLMITPILLASMAQADPYCSDLLQADTLPGKYAKNAPIYSDAASGWIFTRDQLKDRYDMKPPAQALVTQIVAEFARRDVALAIVVPPPRPVVAGQAQLDAAMGGAHYDLGAARASFSGLVAGLAATGAIVPDLQQAALTDPAVREAFYFRRDTHWTTTGSAISAIHLAAAVNRAYPDLFANDGMFTAADLRQAGDIEEKGSLAGIIRQVCETPLGNETAQAFDLTRASEGGLLGEPAQSPAIALLGSSFSNRYKRDHYRFGDALARAFDSEVVNYSVSGGGPIGAIEAYVLSGALEKRAHDLVIWEVPYTENFNSTSFLHQLLGALRLQDQTPHMSMTPKQAGAKAVVMLTNDTPVTGIEIVAKDARKQNFRVELHFKDGPRQKLSLRRREAVPAEMRSERLFGSLEGVAAGTLEKITVAPAKGAEIAQLHVY